MLVSTRVVVQYSSRRVVERDWRIVAVPKEDVAKQQGQAKGHLPLLKGKLSLVLIFSDIFLKNFVVFNVMLNCDPPQENQPQCGK